MDWKTYTPKADSTLEKKVYGTAQKFLILLKIVNQQLRKRLLCLSNEDDLDTHILLHRLRSKIKGRLPKLSTKNRKTGGVFQVVTVLQCIDTTLFRIKLTV